MSLNSLLVTNISLSWILSMQDYSWRSYKKRQVNHKNLQWFRSKTFKTLIMAKRFFMKIQKIARRFFVISLFDPLVPFILCKSHLGVPMTWKGLAHDVTGVTTDITSWIAAPSDVHASVTKTLSGNQDIMMFAFPRGTA